MILQSKFGYVYPYLRYCNLYESRMDYGKTDRRMLQLLDAPGGPFRPGAVHKFTLRVASKHVCNKNMQNI